MTSFTRKLYNQDPAAAEAFHRAQQFEHRLTYGKHVTLACFNFDPKRIEHSVSDARAALVKSPQPTFGRRVGKYATACAAGCGHPACKHGCTLAGR